MRGDKIQRLKQATRRLVTDLDGSDRIHVTFVSDRTDSTWDGFAPATPNTTEKALDAIENLQATGSTNIADAIQDGFGPLDEAHDRQRLPVIVFLTNCQPTREIQDAEQLRRLALESNSANANVFSLAFGDDADWNLVHGLADDGQGVAQRVQADAGAGVHLERSSPPLPRPSSPISTSTTPTRPRPPTASAPPSPSPAASSSTSAPSTHPTPTSPQPSPHGAPTGPTPGT